MLNTRFRVIYGSAVSVFCCLCRNLTHTHTHTHYHVCLLTCLNSTVKLSVSSAPSFTILFTVQDISYSAKSLAAGRFIISPSKKYAWLDFFICQSPWPVSQKVNFGHWAPFFHRFSVPCWRILIHQFAERRWCAGGGGRLVVRAVHCNTSLQYSISISA